jgi:GDSL-like Lipase/Acylhydrolase family
MVHRRFSRLRGGKGLVIILFVTAIGLVVIAEVSLRLLFGFGNPLLYVADEQIGYLLAPNQRVRRFGNRILINAYSMRSLEIAPDRSPETLRIFLVGDSVANGAWWTDQEEIISEMLRRSLLPLLPKTSFQQVEVLNASANSWCPRNELAYLRRFGSFQSQIVVLLINTDDLFGTAPTAIQVGRDGNYPDRKPPLALVEVVSRYLLKPKPIPEMEAVRAEGGDRVAFNLEAIEQIQAIVTQTDGRLLLAMTPLLREIGTPGSRDYEIKARQRLQEFAAAQQIPYIDFLPLFNANPEPQTLYRDHIHLSPEGNQLVSQTLIAQLQQFLEKPQP